MFSLCAARTNASVNRCVCLIHDRTSSLLENPGRFEVEAHFNASHARWAVTRPSAIPLCDIPYESRASQQRRRLRILRHYPGQYHHLQFFNENTGVDKYPHQCTRCQFFARSFFMNSLSPSQHTNSPSTRRRTLVETPSFVVGDKRLRL